MKNDLSILSALPEKRILEYMRICLRFKLDFIETFDKYLSERKNDNGSYKTISKFSFEQFCLKETSGIDVYSDIFNK